MNFFMAGRAKDMDIVGGVSAAAFNRDNMVDLKSAYPQVLLVPQAYLAAVMA